MSLEDEIELNIGAKFDEYHGSPILLKAKIKKLSDGKFTLKNKQSHLASMMGMNINMGLSAVIKNEKLTLLLTSINDQLLYTIGPNLDVSIPIG